jgi:hypothetical protein
MLDVVCNNNTKCEKQQQQLKQATTNTKQTIEQQ